MPFLGAHMPTAGGLHRAFDHIRTVDGQALQLFTRNQRQWSAPPLTDAAVDAFRAAWSAWPSPHVASHGSYLVNPATPDPELAAKSVVTLVDELQRAEALGLPWHIIHPGASRGLERSQAVALAAQRLDEALEQSATTRVRLVVETTSGQGSSLGGSFEGLAELLARCRHGHRLAVCLDTCHVFAAGYELRTPEGYAATMARFQALVGLERLVFFHLNDSLGPLGSRRDRHAHIGQGQLGVEAFRLLLTDPRWANHPMVLETPKDASLADDVRNLGVLHGLMEAGEVSNHSARR